MKRIVTLALMMLIGSYGVVQAQTQEEVAATDAAASRAAEGESATEIEEATKMQEATKDFLGLEWGAGIGVMGSFGSEEAVEKASIVNNTVQVDEEGDMRPQLFLEMHVLLFGGGGKVGNWRDYQRKKAKYQMARAAGNQSTASTTPSASTAPSSTNAPPAASQPTSPPAGTTPSWPEPPLWGFGPFIALQSSDQSAIDALALGAMWGFRKSPDATTSVNVGVGVSFDPSVQVLAKGFNEGGPPPNEETEVRFKKAGRLGWVLMTSFTF